MPRLIVAFIYIKKTMMKSMWQIGEMKFCSMELFPGIRFILAKVIWTTKKIRNPRPFARVPDFKDGKGFSESV